MTVRLVDLQRAAALARDRAELVGQLEIAKGNGLGVTIQGRYQDDIFLEAVRPAVIRELRRRIETFESELIRLGVDI